ncbi:hypothetical protein HDU98_002655 [Podochytrium sp. JEL0797]|nr:hypothetical protein HDU98_002655 [Podochytrium sp. JEL0797]
MTELFGLPAPTTDAPTASPAIPLEETIAATPALAIPASDPPLDPFSQPDRETRTRRSSRHSTVAASALKPAKNSRPSPIARSVDPNARHCPVPGCKRTNIVSEKQMYYHMRDCHADKISVKFRDYTRTIHKNIYDGRFHCLGCESHFGSPSSMRSHAANCFAGKNLSSKRAKFDDDEDEFGEEAVDPIYEPHLNYRTIISKKVPYLSLPHASKVTIKQAVKAFFLEQLGNDDLGECLVLASDPNMNSTYSVPERVREKFTEWVDVELPRLVGQEKSEVAM